MAGHRHSARRYALAQNVLRSAHLAAEIVREAQIGSHELVLEIGAGTGMLTRELARVASRVIAIEADPSWASSLRIARVDVVCGDALEVALPAQPFRVVSNVPFNRTTDVLRRLLDPRAAMTRADLIVQWELACKRIAASPRTLLAVQWAPWWRLAVTARIERESFQPVPRVDAALLTITRRNPPLLPPAAAAAFRQFTRTRFERDPNAGHLSMDQWVRSFARR